MKKYGGRLENWYEKTITYESGKPSESVVFGNVYDDPRWSDGTKVRTSLVVSLNEDQRTLETMNTNYSLGEPLNMDEYKPTGLWYGIDEHPSPEHIDDTD